MMPRNAVLVQQGLAIPDSLQTTPFYPSNQSVEREIASFDNQLSASFIEGLFIPFGHILYRETGLHRGKLEQGSLVTYSSLLH